MLPTLNYEREKHLYVEGKYNLEDWLEFNYVIGNKLKDFLITLKTCVDIENPREMV